MEKLYEIINKLSHYKSLHLGNMREDFVGEMFLELSKVAQEKINEAFVYRAMIRQRFNKHNPVYKKLFKYNDTMVAFVDGEENLIVDPDTENNENELDFEV